MKAKHPGLHFPKPKFNIFDANDERESVQKAKPQQSSRILKSIGTTPSTHHLSDVSGKYVQIISASPDDVDASNFYARHKLRKRYI